MVRAAKSGISKTEAVRQVLIKHGKETMPTDIVKFVKKEHGLDITVGTASTYKGTLLKKLAAEGDAPPAPTPADDTPEQETSVAPAEPANGTPELANGKKVNKMEAVREVI